VAGGYQTKTDTIRKYDAAIIDYIHNNPLKRGYVDEAKHWRYSSARDYEGINGLLKIERCW
jgi:hypothetical protein